MDIDKLLKKHYDSNKGSVNLEHLGEQSQTPKTGNTWFAPHEGKYPLNTNAIVRGMSHGSSTVGLGYYSKN